MIGRFTTCNPRPGPLKSGRRHSQDLVDDVVNGPTVSNPVIGIALWTADRATGKTNKRHGFAKQGALALDGPENPMWRQRINHRPR